MPPKSLRHAPRNPTRRSREERQALDRVEAERRQVRAEASAASAAVEAASRRPNYGRSATSDERWRSSASRGHGLGGSLKYVRGGRGGFIGQSRQPETKSRAPKPTSSTDAATTTNTQTAAGPDRVAGPQRRRGRNAGTESDAAPVVKADPEGDPSALINQLSVKPEEISSDEESDFGLDIDQFNRGSGDNQEGSDDDVQLISERKILPKPTPGGMAPVRMQRKLHVDRSQTFGLPIVASTSLHRRDVKGKTRKESDAAGVDRTTVKQEPVSTETIQPQAVSDDEDDEEAQRATDGSDEEGLSPTTSRNRAQRRASRASTKRPPILTVQDEIEYEKQQQDLEDIRNELGRDPDAPVRAKVQKPTTASRRGAASAAEPEDPPDQKAGAVYLFQLPPILPDLYDASTLPSKAGSPESSKKGYVQPSRSAMTGYDPAHAIKVEDADTVTDGQPSVRNPGSKGPHLSPGLAGQLVVRKSGRTTLTWGGTSMEVNLGISPYFVQTVVMADIPHEQPNGDGDNGDVQVDEEGRSSKAEAVSFGQVRGKFIVTPDWNEILG